MALTEVENIYNLALGYIGEYEVEDGQTTTKQYLACARFYPRARDEILTRHLWNEAVAQVEIINDDTPPLFDYDYKFAVPSGCLRIISVGSPTIDWQRQGAYIVTDNPLDPPEWSADTEVYVAGQYVDNSSSTYLCGTTHTPSTFAADAAYWTDQEDEYKLLRLTYVQQLTDTTLWSELLRNAVALNLAAKVSVPLCNDVKLKDGLLSELERLVLPTARSVDAMQGTPYQIYHSTFLDARKGGSL